MNRTRRAFDYQPPTYEEATKISERGNSRYDNFIKENGPKFFKPKSGDNFIRILPPTWENYKHYAWPIKLHRNIGPDNQTYLCLAENENSPERNCPICEERSILVRRKAPQNETDVLRANSSSLIYLIDRNNEDQGPLIWTISNKSDLEILAQSIDKRTRTYLPIVNLLEGYDIEFIRDGEKLGTRYRGFKVARTSSPVTDNGDKLDEWLDFIEDNPIPDILQFFSSERIKLIFYGRGAEEEDTQPERIRETARPIRESENPDPNQQDEPPFEVERERPTSREIERPVPRAAETSRPAPREVEPTTERRRATLDNNSGTERKPMDDLRARIARRTEGA